MAIWTSTDFTGGSVGTNPTIVTEPIFASAGGVSTNMEYDAALPSGVTGQSVEVTNSRDFVLDVSSKTHWRIGMWVERVSGTQSAGQACILLRSTTTNRADLFLRNQNGGEWALRQGSGGTTYSGQYPVTVTNGGGWWWVEFEYETVAGPAYNVALHLWEPGNATATPDVSYTGTVAGAVDNVRLFNPTGVTGLTMRFAGLQASEGEQIRTGSTAGTLLSNIVGAQTDEGFKVVAWTDDATDVSLVVSESSDLSSPTTFGPESPDAQGYVTLTADGLDPDTLYYWGVDVDSDLDTSINGECRTLPTPGTPHSFSFLAGSCIDWIGSNIFATLEGWDSGGALFMAHLGDFHYNWITAGAGTPSPDNAASLRAPFETYWTDPDPGELWRHLPIYYAYSDTDGGGANQSGETASLANGTAAGVVRQMFPGDYADADTLAKSWVVGRVRFIQTDERTKSSAKANTDNSSKSKLGTAQKTWFKAQLSAAKAAGQFVVWFVDTRWVGNATSGTDQWSSYSTERQELADYITSNGISLMLVHGDTHVLMLDDGTNNPYGGFPWACCAPMSTTTVSVNYPTSHGLYPVSTVQTGRQFGYFEVDDDGSTLTITARAIAANQSPQERFSMTVEWSPPITPTGDALFWEWTGSEWVGPLVPVEVT